MSKFNPREQSLIDSLNTRLADADAITADSILKEIESAPEYKSPSHPDHFAFLHMIPLAMGKQMELAGQDPLASGTDPDSSMLNNQRFTHDIYPQEKQIDYSGNQNEYDRKRKNAADYLQKLQAGEVEGLSNEDKNIHIKAAQENLIQIDSEHAAEVETLSKEKTRAEKQETEWAGEESTRRAEMKKDFMHDRLKNVLPDDKARVQELADTAWARLQEDYGF